MKKTFISHKIKYSIGLDLTHTRYDYEKYLSFQTMLAIIGKFVWLNIWNSASKRGMMLYGSPYLYCSIITANM